MTKKKLAKSKTNLIKETAQDLINYYFNEAELDGEIEWKKLDTLANRLQLALQGKL